MGLTPETLGEVCMALWECPVGGQTESPYGVAVGPGAPVPPVQIVKELLIHGADPNLLLTRGLGSALCVVCDISYESYRNLEGKLALVSLHLSLSTHPHPTGPLAHLRPAACPVWAND